MSVRRRHDLWRAGPRAELRARRSRHRRGPILAALLILGSAPITSARAATSRYVDRSNSSCSDAGTGTASQPFCSISGAAAKAVAGDVVLVSSGTYTEDVSPAHSGTSSSPIVFQPNGSAGVTIKGKSNGFSISGRTWITVRGFTISDTTSYGIYVSGSSNIVLENNHVVSAGSPTSELKAFGIKLTETTSSSIRRNEIDHNSDSGIDLVHGSTGITIDGNEIYSNARGYTRAAAGIEILSGSNTAINNVTHNNEDSGINVRSGASGTLVANNVVYENGDHGIDVAASGAQRVLSNTVYKNVTSGINVEGGASASVTNNVSVDNGINSPRSKGDFRVDSSSTGGTRLDYDLAYLSSSSTLVVWGGSSFSSISAFRSATGQEAHGLQSPPKFVSVGSDNYRLSTGSPAIDSANSGATGERTTDADGSSRFDDPATPNTGSGPRSFDDRGAYEFH